MENMTKEEMQMFEQFKLFMKMQQNNEMATTPKKKKSFSRRARGTGSVYSLGGNRNKPFVASITVGKDDETGSQIQKVIGYFATREEAETTLSIYIAKTKGYDIVGESSPEQNKKPKCPTFKQIWDIVFDEDIIKLSDSSQTNYRTAFKKLKEVHSLPINEITLHELQPIFDNEMRLGSGLSKLSNIKCVSQKIFIYAMKYDYVEKDYSTYISFEPTNAKRNTRTPFTHDEIEKLFLDNTLESKIILIYLYTGMRPQELINISKENVHLDKSYMIGGIKTSNGKDRIIPVHNAIKDFVKELLDSKTKFMLYNICGRGAVDKYRNSLFNPTMGKLGMKHEPYDTRHTFATLCNENNLNEYLIKKMMGHSSNDLTKDVYTHATIERLVKEVNKLPTFK